MVIMVIMVIMVFVIIMIFVIIMVIMVIMVIMSVSVECASLAEVECGKPMTFHKRNRLRIFGDAFNRVLQKRFKVMAHPENKIGFLQLFRL